MGKTVADHVDKPDDEARDAEFVRLLTSHQLDIYLYVHSLVPDRNDAAEIVQDANVVLWEKRNQFEEDRGFRPWAFQVARYEVLKYRTKRKRKCLSFSDALVDELAIEVCDYPPLNDDSIDEMRRCIEQLAVRDREVLRQRYLSMVTCENIAKTIGRPVTWVYNALRRIRQELLDCITRYANMRGEP
jgi:RNA polymerase sigma-70 factor, ECF subfamily